MAKIFVAIPTYNKQVDIEIMSVFAQLPGHYNGKHIFGLDFMQSSLVSYARNYLVKKFLETDFEWLYFWDADIVIRDLSFIEKLLETSEKLDAKVVGGVYRLKSSHPTHKQYAAGNTDTKGNVANVSGIQNFIVGELKEPQLADVIATGSMLIHRSVLETVPDPWFTIVDLPHGQVIPEDYNFCANARKTGFTVAVDPRFDTYHFGTSYWQHHYEKLN